MAAHSVMTDTLCRVFDRLLGVDSEGYERLLALSGLAWGLAAVVAEPTPVAPAALFAPIAGGAGALHLLGLMTARRRLRLVASWISMPFWWSVAALVAGDLTQSATPAVYLVLAVLGSWACVLLTGNAYDNGRR